MSSSSDHAGPVGVRGWLLVFCLLLLVWQPVSLALSAASVLESVPLRGLPLALLIGVRVLVAAFGIAAGIAILRRATGALTMAKTSVMLSAAADVFTYATPYWPNNRPPGDVFAISAGALIYYAAWTVYLRRSRRVRTTLRGER